MELTEVIEKRRSIRKFSDKPVSREILEVLIKAAALAPTASNLQAWRFFVADDPELVRDIDSFSPGLSGKPPVIIAIASDLAEAERRGSKNSLVYGLMMDAAMAAENLMLKATDLGLGTCAIKSYNDKAVHKLLKLPDTMRLEILISRRLAGGRTTGAEAKGHGRRIVLEYMGRAGGFRRGGREAGGRERSSSDEQRKISCKGSGGFCFGEYAGTAF